MEQARRPSVVAAGVVLGLGLGMVLLGTPVSGGDGGALSASERQLLRDPETARKEVIGRVDRAQAALATMEVEGLTDPRRLSTLRRELAKAQRALEVEDYKAAYLFTRRLEGWTTAEKGVER